MGRRAAASPLNSQPLGGGPPAPSVDPASKCGCGGCPQGPETPSSHTAPDRTGRRRGRDGAVSHFPLQSKTHRHAPGTTAPRRAQLRAPDARARPAPDPRVGGSGEAPGPAGGPGVGTARTHTPSPSSPQRSPAVGSGKARLPGAAGYSPHNTGVFSSEAGHAEAAPLSPGTRLTRVHPRPRGGRATKCVERLRRA